MKNTHISHVQLEIEEIASKIRVMHFTLLNIDIEDCHQGLIDGLQRIASDVNDNLHGLHEYVETHKQPVNVKEFLNIHERILTGNNGKQGIYTETMTIPDIA